MHLERPNDCADTFTIAQASIFGYYGLAKVNYTDFPSTIRRYTVLVVHRILGPEAYNASDDLRNSLDRLSAQNDPGATRSVQAVLLSVNIKN